MTYRRCICHPDDLPGVGISSGWVTANSLCHPDDILFHFMSSGWLNWGWFLIRMSYGNVIMSSGWDTLPFLSHPDEIANFDFPQHAVALQRFRSFPPCTTVRVFLSSTGRSFEPHCGGGKGWRKLRFRSPSWITSFPLSVDSKSRKRKRCHLRWRSEEEVLSPSTATTKGAQKSLHVLDDIISIFPIFDGIIQNNGTGNDICKTFRLLLRSLNVLHRSAPPMFKWKWRHSWWQLETEVLPSSNATATGAQKALHVLDHTISISAILDGICSGCQNFTQRMMWTLWKCALFHKHFPLHNGGGGGGGGA